MIRFEMDVKQMRNSGKRQVKKTFNVRNLEADRETILPEKQKKKRLNLEHMGCVQEDDSIPRLWGSYSPAVSDVNSPRR